MSLASCSFIASITTTARGRLMLTVLGGRAEFERGVDQGSDGTKGESGRRPGECGSRDVPKSSF
jgi:hypothetical protein